MSKSWLTEARPDTFHKVTIGSLVSISLLALGTGGWAAYTSSQGKASELRIRTINNELREVQSSLKQVDKVLASGSQIAGPVGKPIVVKFQASVEKTARENEVRVEFTQVGDPALFISRFKNEPDSTLQQIELKMSLGGSVSQVTRTLDQISSYRIPFEFGEMSIERDTSASGMGKIIAHVTAFVLVPVQV